MNFMKIVSLMFMYTVADLITLHLTLRRVRECITIYCILPRVRKYISFYSY